MTADGRKGNGGSSAPVTATASVTTDANTFLGSHVFDLGDSPHQVDLTITLMATTPDGETFGTGAGDLGVVDILTAAGGAPGWATSPDGVTYEAMTPVLSIGRDVNGNLSANGEYVRVIVPSWRYLKIGVGVVDVNSDALYAGANHPQATVRYDIAYR